MTITFHWWIIPVFLLVIGSLLAWRESSSHGMYDFNFMPTFWLLIFWGAAIGAALIGIFK